MRDVYEVETRIQTVMNRDPYPLLRIHLMLCADSDIIHVNVLGMIILNSYEVTTDLLNKRSSTYSSR